MHSIDVTIPFVVETNASGHTIDVTINQAGRQEVFFSSPLKHTAIGKAT